MKKYAIPRRTSEFLNSTNGFTIDKRYPIRWDNGRVAKVYNDNGHERIIPLDHGSNAHLQHRNDKPGFLFNASCAGYFEIIEE